MKITSIVACAAALFTTALAAIRPERVTFDSSGTQLVGYHWKPACKDARGRISRPGRQVPIVVMAHGLAALQSSKLQPYAEKFAQEGYHAMTFDYRHWGQSDGQPRNIVDLNLQQDDYRAAVKFARKLKGVDPNRVVIWGSSLSGGTVLNLGAYFYNDTTSGVVGVISQVPHTNGPSTASLPPQETLPNLIQLSLADIQIGKADNGTQPIYVPVANYTGQLGLLTQPGALDGYLSIQPDPPGPEFSNIAARFIVSLPLFSPDAIAFQSKLPTYIGIGLNDNVVSPTAAIALSKKMPNATTYQYEGVGHFDVYPGASAYKINLDNQVAFLKKEVPILRPRQDRPKPIKV